MKNVSTKLSNEETENLKLQTILGSLLIGCVLAVIYWPSMDGPLAFDDFTLLNETVRLPDVREWLRPETRPLSRFLFAIEGRLFGDHPMVHRWSSILIHWIASLLLWRLATIGFATSKPRLVTAPQAGFFVALAWAAHPLQTECIAYLIQRSEALMGLFFFAFLCCLSADQRLDSEASVRVAKQKQSAVVVRLLSYRWQVMAVICFIAGLWSKTIMVTALAVGPLFDRAFLSNSWKQLWQRRGLLYLGPVALGLFATLALLPGILRGEANVGFGGDAPPLMHHLAAQSKVIWQYLFLALLPTDLSIDHGVVAPAFWYQNLAWIVMSLAWVFIGIALGVFSAWRTSFIVLAPLIILSPTSSIVPTADLLVEHRMYLPLAAILAGVTVILVNAVRVLDSNVASVGRRWLVIMSIWVLALASRTMIRSSDYRSGVQLWSQAVTSNPVNDRAIQNLIDAAIREKRVDILNTVLLQAIEACESKSMSPAVPMQRLGELMVKSGRCQDAILILSKAIELDEAEDYAGYQPPQRFRDRAAMHVNRALAILGSGADKQLAKVELEKAFGFHDWSADARAMAGGLCQELQLVDEALRHFQRALELKPNWPEVKADIERLVSDQVDKSQPMD